MSGFRYFHALQRVDPINKVWRAPGFQCAIFGRLDSAVLCPGTAFGCCSGRQASGEGPQRNRDWGMVAFSDVARLFAVFGQLLPQSHKPDFGALIRGDAEHDG